MKNPIKVLRTLVVTKYANRIYTQSVKAAEARWEKEKTMIYVVTPQTNRAAVELLSRNQFREIKRKSGMDRIDVDWLKRMKEGCWYHTGNAAAGDRLSAADIEARRLTFIKWTLERAGIK